MIIPIYVTSWISLAVAIGCAALITLDLLRGNRQQMWIMEIVWPITALYGSVIALYAYFTVGRLSTRKAVAAAKQQGAPPPGKRKPFWQITAVATPHCGSGCAVADIVGEWVLFFFPFTLFNREVFAAWIIDYALALIFGLAFQYFTIVPMRDLSPGRGILAAAQADTLSLTSWQVGMYGFMAVVIFGVLGHPIEKDTPIFWFAMQVAMWFGFFASYPVNWLLLKLGIKEEM